MTRRQAARVASASPCAPSARWRWRVPGTGPQDPRLLTVAVRTAPNRLDPRQGSDEASQRMAQLIFNPLMEFGDDLQVKPGLAERLENPDPLTYIAHLRKGVRFHDGQELTSKDVVYTFGAFLDPAFSRRSRAPIAPRVGDGRRRRTPSSSR